jgi:xanthosine utilization system XapX-like protein
MEAVMRYFITLLVISLGAGIVHNIVFALFCASNPYLHASALSALIDIDTIIRIARATLPVASVFALIICWPGFGTYPILVDSYISSFFNFLFSAAMFAVILLFIEVLLWPVTNGELMAYVDVHIFSPQPIGMFVGIVTAYQLRPQPPKQEESE